MFIGDASKYLWTFAAVTVRFCHLLLSGFFALKGMGIGVHPRTM
jgi:hypothetical protein